MRSHIKNIIENTNNKKLKEKLEEVKEKVKNKFKKNDPGKEGSNGRSKESNYKNESVL